MAAFAREWNAARQREQQTISGGTEVPLALQSGKRGPVWGHDDEPDLNRRLATTTRYLQWASALHESETD